MRAYVYTGKGPNGENLKVIIDLHGQNADRFSGTDDQRLGFVHWRIAQTGAQLGWAEDDTKAAMRSVEVHEID